MRDMKNIYWFNIEDKSVGKVYAVIQQAYRKSADVVERYGAVLPRWSKLDLYKVNLGIMRGNDFYNVSRQISAALFKCKDVFEKRLKDYATKYVEYMSRVLTMDDFVFIQVGEVKSSGYYSYKTARYEICLDHNHVNKWTVYFCNRNEEVLEEKSVRTKRKALVIANEYYRSFATRCFL